MVVDEAKVVRALTQEPEADSHDLIVLAAGDDWGGERERLSVSAPDHELIRHRAANPAPASTGFPTRICPACYVLQLVLLTLVTSSCVRRSPFVTGDPEATFVAHQANSILVLDQVVGGHPLTLRPKRSWPLGSVVYVPSAGDWTLSLAGPGEVTVAHTNDPGRDERVVPSWDNNAIRLMLERHEHPPLRTDVFARVTDGAGPSLFTRLDQMPMDIRGSYQGAVRDRAGTQVGWLRLRVGEDEAHVVCEGVLPPDVDETMIAATLLALASEVESIENHFPESRPESDL